MFSLFIFIFINIFVETNVGDSCAYFDIVTFLARFQNILGPYLGAFGIYAQGTILVMREYVLCILGAASNTFKLKLNFKQ